MLKRRPLNLSQMEGEKERMVFPVMVSVASDLKHWHLANKTME